MVSSLLIKNADVVATLDSERSIIRNGSIYIEDNQIVKVGPASEVDFKADQEIDASGKIVLPGLINTHHHLYQTLFRNIPAVQNATLFDWLLNLYEMWREITLDAIYVSAKVGMVELLLSGCTTTSDHLYVFPQGEEGVISDEMRAAGDLGIRFHPCRGSMSLGRSQGGLPPDDIVQSEEEILHFYKLIIDKYHDPSKYSMNRIVLGPCSPFSVTEALLRETRELSRQKGVFCHTHLAETLDEEKFCIEQKGKRPFEYMASVGWTGPDVWYAHGIHLNGEEINQLAETGTGVSHCPTSNLRLGSGIAPVRELLDAGVSVSIGVDGSASNDSSDLLFEVRQTMLLQRAKYGVDAMTATEALELATIGGARCLGRDDIGWLGPGMAADIIGIDLNQIGLAGALHDPVTAIVFCKSRGVDFSIINGKPVVLGGKVDGLDMNELIARQNQIASELLDRAEECTGQRFRDKEWKRAYDETSDSRGGS
jgi:cytosine/adenosine deaminase-related metal-dependent hydrolase